MKRRQSPLFILALFIVAAGTFLYISSEVISENFKPGPLSYRYRPQTQIAQVAGLSGLIAEYTFDGNDMLVNVADHTGNGNNADLIGFTSTSTLAGKIGMALNFDGASDFVALPPSLPSVGDFSIATWVRMSTDNSRSTLFGTSDGSFRVLVNQLYNYTEAKLGTGTASGKSIASADGWTHVVFVRSGSTATLYINGVPTINAFSVGAAPVNLANLSIGQASPYDHFNLTGALDDTQIYGRALSASEVQQLYSGSQTVSAQPATNQPPAVNAGGPYSLVIGGNVTVRGVVYDDGLPAGSTLTETWSKVSGPGTVTFTTPNAISTNVTFSVAGSYTIRLTASDGALSSTADATVTVAPDTTPPVMSGAAPTGLLRSGTTQVTLSLTTDEAATCRYSTTAGTPYSAMTGTFSTTGATSHSTAITGLSDGHTYSYFVRCQDTSGNADTTDAPVFFSVLSAGGGTIPSDRMVDWTHAGVPGGIPTRSTICANVKDPLYGAKGDGVTNDGPAIQRAINACPAGQVVFIPAGVYLIDDTSAALPQAPNGKAGLRIDHPIVIRGQLDGNGNRLTKLLEPSGYYGNTIFSPTRGSWAAPDFVTWTSGYAKDSTVIGVSDTSRFSVGQEVLLDQHNDPALVNPVGYSDTCAGQCGRNDNPLSFDGAHIRAQSHMAKITAIGAGTITIDTPLHFTAQASLSPQVFFWTTPMGKGNMQYAGIEDIQIDGENLTNYLVDFTFCTYCWAKNIETDNVLRSGVVFRYSYKSTMRDSIVRGQGANGPEHYGVELWMAGSNLVEDNIFEHAGPIIMSYPSSDNVIAYNYVVDASYGSSWLFQELSTHAAHSDMNLFEGNVAGQIMFDFVHGSASHNTVFRNRITGYEDGKTNNTIAVSIEAWNRFMNIVGNVLGTPGFSTVYELSQTPAVNMRNHAVYEIGYWDQQGGTANYDWATLSTTLRHGNYDYASNSVKWDPAIDNHTLPASLYLSGQPSWWNTWGSTPWPPIGPDVSGLANKIPAQLRYAQLQNGISVQPVPNPTTSASPTATPTSSATPTPTPTSVQNTVPADRSNGAPSGTIPFSSAVTLSLTTNENATCKYSTLAGQSYANMTLFSTTGGLTHSSLINNLTDGSYSYYVKCKDQAGNVNLDDYPIIFSIAPRVVPTVDTQAPSVIISRPLPGQTYTTGKLSVQASASDNVGVAGVTFMIDGYQLGSEDTNPPYSVNWKATVGAHTIYVVARDAAGNTTKSTTISVNIVSR